MALKTMKHYDVVVVDFCV